MMTLEEFMNLHDACNACRDWVRDNKITTLQEAWDKTKPYDLIWIATRPGVLDERTLRLFAVWCARRVQHLMTDPRSISALDVAESHANGQATNEELAAAGDAAWDAAGDAQVAWLRKNAKPNFEKGMK
jgi:hypothetical protein